MGPHETHRFLFYSSDLAADAASAQLEGDEHKHLKQVLRMGPGETVFVTNGRGHLVRGEIETVDRSATTFRVTEVMRQPGSVTNTVLALACLRKEAFELAVKQCTELGVTGFAPFVSSRCHIRQYSPAFLERLRRIALSSMKQSFRATLPAIEAPIDFEALVPLVPQYGRTIVGEASARRVPEASANVPTLIVVGPEAGLAHEEVERLKAAGGEFARATATRLRSETAAAALVSLVLSDS